MAAHHYRDRLIGPMHKLARTTTMGQQFRPAASGTGLGYRPALDGLRGVAIVAVLAYHFGVPGAGGGFLGVDLFFVLSGFLIGSLLAGELATTGRVDLVRFWARRARRLLPALVVVAIGIAIWTRMAGDWDTWGVRRDELLATLGYVANWHFVGASSDYFAAAAGASPLQHTWSLGIEEQFYLLWPILFLVAVRIGGRRRVVPIALASLLVVASVAAAGVLFDPASPSRAYYGTDTRIHQILIGVVLGLAMRPWRRPQAVRLRERQALAIAQLPLALLLLAGFVFADATDVLYYRGGSLMLALVAAGLIFTIERAPTGPVARLLSTRLLVAAGVISYGLYLWHWPVVVATAPADPAAGALSLVALRLALTVGLATAMYLVVERPIREGRLPVIRRSSWRTLAAAATAIVIAAGISLQATDLGAPAGIKRVGKNQVGGLGRRNLDKNLFVDHLSAATSGAFESANGDYSRRRLPFRAVNEASRLRRKRRGRGRLPRRKRQGKGLKRKALRLPTPPTTGPAGTPTAPYDIHNTSSYWSGIKIDTARGQACSRIPACPLAATGGRGVGCRTIRRKRFSSSTAPCIQSAVSRRRSAIWLRAGSSRGS